MILARPISRIGFVAGKALGAGWMIGALLLAAFLFNVVLFAAFTGLFPNAGEMLRLLLFMITAFVYMMVFYLFSLLVSIHSRDRSFSFLILMAVWICVSFVIPQLADMQRSHAWAIANATGTAAQIPVDTAVSNLIDWFSPAVQFKHIGEALLQIDSESAEMGAGAVFLDQISQFLYLLILSAISAFLSMRAVKKESALC